MMMTDCEASYRSLGHRANHASGKGRMHEDPFPQTLDHSAASNASDWTIRRRFVAQTSLTRSTTSQAVITTARCPAVRRVDAADSLTSLRVTRKLVNVL